MELLSLPSDYYTHYLEHVATTTTETANAALRARIDPKNLVVTVVGTAKTTLDSVSKAIGALASTETVAYDSESRS